MKIRKVKVHIKKKCPYWEKYHWLIKGYDTCNGTKDREPCKCGGDRNKCNFYGRKKEDEQ